jgi:bifunctional DNA-binding transcriptional regulator/antitoxin component of YhaV-PrlF toxin-antitoxin module
MDHLSSNRIDKHGVWVIPAILRQRYGLEEGTWVVAEPRPDGILLKSSAPALPKADGQANAWHAWFGLMAEIKVTTDDIHEAKLEGRR